MLRFLLVLLAIYGLGAQAGQPSTQTKKILRVAINVQKTGFDPAKVMDSYSVSVVENIFDPLLTYDYLARPAKLIPNTVEALPKISRDGKTYWFRIKPGIYFAPDPIFAGKKRELIAQDYVYSLKRLVDPTVGSPVSYLVRGKFIGLDALARETGKGKLDYAKVIEGIKALDRYTLQLTLTQPVPELLYLLAMPQLGAVAREVIDAYASNTHAHPIGTGPYLLYEWKPGNRIILEANPNFRRIVFDYTNILSLAPNRVDASADKQSARSSTSLSQGQRAQQTQALDREIAAQMNGKTMPQIKRIEISVIEQEQPAWLAFKSRQLDLVSIPQNAVYQALDIDRLNPSLVTLKPELTKLGVRLYRRLEPEITFHAFNMKDSVVGGYAKEKIALRRAIAMAFPVTKTIAEIRRGQAVRMEYLIPPGVAGHNPHFLGAFEYNPALANALLDKFGYQVGADGWRTLPNGRPLVINYLTGPTAVDKQWNEYWQKTFDTLKIQVNFKIVKWNEQLKLLHECQYGLAGSAWVADYPDGDNFVQLLYGKNVANSNVACYQSEEYDALYEQAHRLPDGAERNRLYDKMNKIVMADTPWIFGDIRFRNRLTQAYIQGFKPHPVLQTEWRYLDIKRD